MADIVLINPRFEPSYWGLEHALHLLGYQANLPVAALPLLAALTPEGHSFTLIDENVEAIDFERCARADIVGVTGMSVQRFRMTEVLEELKRRGVFTVVGGPWVTVQEDYFGTLADVIFVGEAENTWPLFLEQWADGKHAGRYEQTEKTDMTKVPVPRHDLLKMSRYALASIQFSRGCPFNCEFCDIIVTFGRRPRIKTSGQVIAELEALRKTPGVDTVFIVDDNLIGNKKAIREVLLEVVAWQRAHDYPMIFFTEASLDLADDAELMALMVAANIRIVFVGIETPNEDSLKETGKTQNLRKGGSMAEKVHAIQNAGMEVWSGMILGFDNDGHDIFERQIRFIQQARIVSSMVGMLSAIPKTPLHDRLAREGRLDPDDRPLYGTNVIPVGMDRHALREGYLRVMRELYDPEAYFQRLDDLYLTGRLRQSNPRREHLRDRPWRRFLLDVSLVAEAAFIFLRLQTKVKDRDLRRHYRRSMGRLLRHLPPTDVLQVYAVKSAMHYHVHTLVSEMSMDGQLVNTF
ncbi:DUF4070 domain-containing protein [Telmatospirillum sp.]|uniref:DUF4070 domain-containing protein n=1 Tax=Telmatospirillum sp. TaxID=2079197 RepID=UPI00283CC752|nr:DUF4070 domain-containing protein [Telmatospirillum sp.]MDR3435176.1 DUF4070 domain-containing protein [Telmatospirillum sp.]